jgi:hypothetical protein
VQGDSGAGAEADDRGGFVAEVLGESPEIVGVGVEAVLEVLWPVESTAGETPPVVEGHGVGPRQLPGRAAQALRRSGRAGHHHQQRPAADALVVQMGSRHGQNTHYCSSVGVGGGLAARRRAARCAHAISAIFSATRAARTSTAMPVHRDRATTVPINPT